MNRHERIRQIMREERLATFELIQSSDLAETEKKDVQDLFFGLLTTLNHFVADEGRTIHLGLSLATLALMFGEIEHVAERLEAEGLMVPDHRKEDNDHE